MSRPYPGSPEDRCDHCGLPFPKPPIVVEANGATHAFCSEMCRDAYADHQSALPVYHGLARVQTGVDGLDAQLPAGLARNAFVLVSWSPGARWEALFAELTWRTLQRDEPVILVAFQQPPIALVQQLLTFEWNVLPYLEDEQLHIIDCFTYRVASYNHMIRSFTDWNAYLYKGTERATTRLANLDTMEAVHSSVDTLATQRGMRGRGLVLVDSLYELGTLTQPVHAYNFVKDLRADLAKGRFVPVFGGVSTTVDESEFPRNMTYLADGLVELNQLFDEPFSAFRKYVCVPEMRGVATRPRWIQFEYEPMDGMVLVPPAEAESSHPHPVA